MRSKERLVTRFTVFALLTLFFVPAVFADDAALIARISGLEKHMAEMQKTIKLQENEITMLKHEKSSTIRVEPRGEFKEELKASIGDADQWLKDLKFSGDTRLRYEPVGFHSGSTAGSGNINRFRFRLRYGFEKKFNPDMKVGFRLASGSTTDATSTNQTLTGNFVNKTITIDRVDAIYTPSWAKVGPIEKFTIGGGKFSNPFEKGSSNIVWDTDVTPEGAYEMLEWNAFANEDLALKGYATFGQFITNQAAHAAGGTSNATVFAYQFGLTPEFKVNEGKAKLNSALSYYDFHHYAQDSNFTANGNINADSNATRLDADAFRILDIYNSLELKPFENMPVVKLYFDWAANVGADNSAGTPGAGENQAFALGFDIGKTKKKHDWKAGYAYRRVESNSTPGAFNDSDFGHSGRRGSVLSTKYMLTDNLEAGFEAFLLNNLNSGSFGKVDEEERRFLLDLVWKF